MKNNILSVCLILAIIFVGCQNDDEYVQPNSFSDVGWYIGYPTSPWPDPLLVNIDDYLTFSDLSQNALSHEWRIPDGSYFLRESLTLNDTIFDDSYIIGSGSTTDKTASVLFRESGIQPVVFSNTFSEQVTFRGPDGLTIDAQPDGDNWKLEHTFMVDVYDTIVPIIDIRQQGVSVPFLSETDIITVEAGDILEFVDLSVKDRVTSRFWEVLGSGNALDSIGIMRFNKLGDFKARVTLSRGGPNIPPDTERYEIPATFRVIPSSKPFVVGGDIIELESEVIQIPFTGEFAPFPDQREFFTVMLDGTTELGIASIATNSDDATILEITLSEPIYRPDVITVSYDGNGTLESTDTRKPVAFTDLPVNMHDVNLFDNVVYGMEDANMDAWISTDDPLLEYTSERVAVGNKCLKFTNIAGADWTRASSENHPGMIPEDGNYTITWWLYIDPSTTAGDYGPWFYWGDGTANEQFWQGMDGKPRGEWFKQTREQDLTAGAAYFTLRIKDGAIIFLDDIRVVKTETRP